MNIFNTRMCEQKRKSELIKRSAAFDVCVCRSLDSEGEAAACRMFILLLLVPSFASGISSPSLPLPRSY